MAAALGDLLQITDFQQYLLQDVLNVYHYRVTSPTGFTNDGYDSILDWYEDNIMADMLPIQSSGLSHVRLLIQNLSNGVDFVDRTLSPAEFGTTGGDGMPPFVSWGFRLIRESLATRNGYKRIGGVAESSQISGEPTAGVLPFLDALAAEFAEDIIVGIVTLAEPVIVKRPISVPMPPGYVYSSIGGADFRSIGTQNTRKFGRGS